MTHTPTKYKCTSCSGEYFDYTEQDQEYYHKCSSGVRDPRDENICTCIEVGHGDNERHSATFPDGRSQEHTHIKANGKGRTRV